MLDQILPLPETQQLSSAPGRLRLIFGASCVIAGNIDVLVRGILISSTPAANSFEAGQHIDLAVNYFPNVQLPAQLRVCVGAQEIALPMELKSADDVMMLAGYGDVEAENLSLEAGLLRGTLVLTGNAVTTPHGFVRINGVVIRSVVVEPPVARHTGGATCRFAVPIRPADFVESGLSVDVHVSGIDYPLANFTYARTDPSADAKRLLKLEEELRQVQKASLTQIEMLNANFQRRLMVQQERLDAFIEYAMSILLDGLAHSTGDAGAGTHGGAEQFRHALSDLRQGAVGGEAVELQAKPISTAEVPISSICFAFGWFDVEVNEQGSFRWMGPTGFVNNPYPNLPIAKVEFLVSRVYGGGDPMLRASADDVEFPVTITADGAYFLVSCAAPAGNDGTCAQSIRLESFRSGSPANDQGTNDSRTLAVAAQKAEFFYHSPEAGPEAAPVAAGTAEHA